MGGGRSVRPQPARPGWWWGRACPREAGGAARFGCGYMCSMTAQGHAYARFRRALKSGNAHVALAAAAELRQVGLADALSLLFVIREDKPVLYDKAAVRWFAKYAAEDR